MFDEERSVAEKAPVDGIQINDLNKATIKKKKNKTRNFSYFIKVADFYYEDSAQIIALAKLSDYWIDIGSGGGFPGIVVAICLKEISPSTCVILVESDLRKAAFLRQAAATLELNCEIHSSRVESLTLARAATVSARALAALPKLLEYAETLVEADGVCLFMKGQSHQDELAAAQKSWSFEHDIVPSQTDIHAAVLKIRNIRRAAA